ncbi:hypothetical protein IWZ00DRAFT_494107 [Phyllosticta capitalensis]
MDKLRPGRPSLAGKRPLGRSFEGGSAGEGSAVLDPGGDGFCPFLVSVFGGRTCRALKQKSRQLKPLSSSIMSSRIEKTTKRSRYNQRVLEYRQRVLKGMKLSPEPRNNTPLLTIEAETTARNDVAGFTPINRLEDSERPETPQDERERHDSPHDDTDNKENVPERVETVQPNDIPSPTRTRVPLSERRRNIRLWIDCLPSVPEDRFPTLEWLDAIQGFVAIFLGRDHHVVKTSFLVARQASKEYPACQTTPSQVLKNTSVVEAIDKTTYRRLYLPDQESIQALKTFCESVKGRLSEPPSEALRPRALAGFGFTNQTKAHFESHARHEQPFHLMNLVEAICRVRLPQYSIRRYVIARLFTRPQTLTGASILNALGKGVVDSGYGLLDNYRGLGYLAPIAVRDKHFAAWAHNAAHYTPLLAMVERQRALADKERDWLDVVMADLALCGLQTRFDRGVRESIVRVEDVEREVKSRY